MIVDAADGADAHLSLSLSSPRTKISKTATQAKLPKNGPRNLCPLSIKFFNLSGNRKSETKIGCSIQLAPPAISKNPGRNHSKVVSNILNKKKIVFSFSFLSSYPRPKSNNPLHPPRNISPSHLQTTMLPKKEQPIKTPSKAQP